MAITTFRDTVRKITPRWLQGWLGERLIYSMAVHLDLLGDMAVAAVKRRHPGLEDEYDSLGLIGRQRRIRRGRNETDANYSARLRPWRENHRVAGGPYALLEQTGAFWATAPFRIDLAYHSGRAFTRDESDGAITRHFLNWTPPSTPTGTTARWWLFFFWPDAISTDGTWADPGDWSDGGVWDSDLAPEDVEDIRLVPSEWNAGHTRGAVVLLAPGIELWDFPAGLWSDPGTWGDDLALAPMLVID